MEEYPDIKKIFSPNGFSGILSVQSTITDPGPYRKLYIESREAMKMKASELICFLQEILKNHGDMQRKSVSSLVHMGTPANAKYL